MKRKKVWDGVDIFFGPPLFHGDILLCCASGRLQALLKGSQCGISKIELAINQILLTERIERNSYEELFSKSVQWLSKAGGCREKHKNQTSSLLRAPSQQPLWYQYLCRFTTHAVLPRFSGVLTEKRPWTSSWCIHYVALLFSWKGPWTIMLLPLLPTSS